MKTLLIILLTTSICSAQLNDKDLHYLSGMTITNLVGSSTFYLTKKPWLSTLTGLTAGCLAGVAKEYYDKRNGRPFDNADLAETIKGSLHGSIYLRVGIDFSQRKQQINNQYRRK